ncbi:MAG: ABC transporter ATP-binding protein [Pseudomonadota bacterium]
MIGPLIKVAGPDGREPLRRNLLGLIAESVLMGIGFVLLVPVLRALFGGNTNAAWGWIAVMAAVLIVYIIVRYRTQLAGYRAAIGLADVLFQRLGDHIARLPLGWFGAERVGQLGRLTSQGVIDVMGVPAHLLRPVVTALTTPATVILLMFFFDWRLALAALITVPFAALIYRWSGDLVQRTDIRVHDAAAEAAGRIVEFAQAQAVLRAFGRDNASLGKLDAALAEQRAAGRAQIFTAARGLVSFVFAIQLAFTLILLFATNLALGGAIDEPELVALLVLAVRYVEPLLGAADLEGALRIARNSLGRMDRLLSTEPLAEPGTPKMPDGADVVFDKVGFSYGDVPLLTDVSFKAEERAMTAIVGASGSGKTTILRLVARFWDVDTGSVRIGGVDVRDMTTEVLMSHISVVFQDVYLFEGSILENVRLGNPQASDEDVIEAMRLARVDEIAARIPGGLSARVGEGGTALSGGERQRVSIARAILKDAPIVLVDEATSALDPVNEAAVQAALRALTRGKTLIVVAHRLQTVRNADRILVLGDGRIAEAGSHEELLKNQSRYAKFWHERSRAEGWRIANASGKAHPQDQSVP